jgi:beta-N-acetylhexosaminidase
MIATMTALHLFTHTPAQITQQMSIEEKVGQLFVIPACPERKDEHLQDLEHLFNDYHVGGIILKQGSSKSYREFLASLKTALPLICVGDAEWGASMRVTDAVRLPRNLTLGAIQDLSLIEKFGRQVGWECRQLGIDLNLAPVADINTNPLNPIIGTRSFGDDPERVAQLVSIVVRAMQEEEILACAKHFPDHGDVTIDSHVDLPKTQIRSLIAFEKAVRANAGALLTAHLLIDDKVVTFSHEIVHELIRNQLKFPGLIVTDGLNMKAVSKYTKPDQAALDALRAGHDLLLYGDHISEKVNAILRESVPQAIGRIVQAVKTGEYPESLLDEHVIRILETKQKLHQRPPVKETVIATQEAIALKQTLYDNAVTLIRNKHLPLKPDEEVRWTVLGGEARILEQAIHPSSNGPYIVCVMKWDDAIKEELRNINPDILIVMASPYGLIDLPKTPTLLIGYENDPMAEESVRKVLFGEMEAIGQLPVKISME